MALTRTEARAVAAARAQQAKASETLRYARICTRQFERDGTFGAIALMAWKELDQLASGGVLPAEWDAPQDEA